MQHIHKLGLAKNAILTILLGLALVVLLILGPLKGAWQYYQEKSGAIKIPGTPGATDEQLPSPKFNRTELVWWLLDEGGYAEGQVLNAEWVPAAKGYVYTVQVTNSTNQTYIGKSFNVAEGSLRKGAYRP